MKVGLGAHTLENVLNAYLYLGGVFIPGDCGIQYITEIYRKVI